MSLLGNLLQIVKGDAGPTAVTALQTFKTNIDNSPTPDTAVAQGTILAQQLALALPSVEGKLIADTTNLLVGDEISWIQSQIAPPATTSAPATNAPATTPSAS